LDARNAEAHSVLASLLARNHAREAAYSQIRTALAQAPKDQNVLSEVAEAYEALGERSLAIKYLHLALQNGFPKMQIEGAIGLIRVSADPEFQKYGK
jgi:Flp pilus assembly protein TadD